jgi:hypothetical protein
MIGNRIGRGFTVACGTVPAIALVLAACIDTAQIASTEVRRKVRDACIKMFHITSSSNYQSREHFSILRRLPLNRPGSSYKSSQKLYIRAESSIPALGLSE